MIDQGFFDKYKKIMLPHISDWSLPYDDKRFRKDWWNMHWIEMYVFNAQVFKWTMGGISFLSSILFTTATILFFIRGNPIGALIFLALAIFMIRSSYLKLKTWKIKHTMNFYDMFFREFKL